MNAEQSIGATCMRWWSSHVAGETGPARQARAQLRRAADTTAALCLPATHDLNRRLIEGGYDLRRRRDGPDRLALIAVALSHVAEHRRDSAARRFGSGDPKTVSGIRFDALIREKNPGRLLRPLVRSLQLAGRTVDVAKLGTDLYWWNDKVRTDWCFDYHGAADAKPTFEKESV